LFDAAKDEPCRHDANDSVAMQAMMQITESARRADPPRKLVCVAGGAAGGGCVGDVA